MSQPQTPETPASCVPHQPDFNSNAWHAYTLEELGCWVHLFTKRAGHRKDRAKAEKDLEDAQNYLNMMQAQINYAKTQLPEK